MVCLPTLRSREYPLPIFVQDTNISLAFELTGGQYHSYRWKFWKGMEDIGYIRIIYSWSLGTINDSSVWDGRCNYSLQPTHKATGGVPMVPHTALRTHGEPQNAALYGMLMNTPWYTPSN